MFSDYDFMLCHMPYKYFTVFYNEYRQTANKAFDNCSSDCQQSVTCFIAAVIPLKLSLQTSISFTVADDQPVTDVGSIRNIYRTSCAGANFTVKVLMEGSHMDYVIAAIATEDVRVVTDELHLFRTNCPGTISEDLIKMTSVYIDSGFFTQPVPNALGHVISKNSRIYKTAVKCFLQSPFTCEVTVTKKIIGK